MDLSHVSTRTRGRLGLHSAPVAPIILTIFLASCSLGRFEYTECTDNATCRTAFGWGYTCGAEGYCEATEPPARCGTVYPDDFWTNREAYKSSIVLGMDYDNAYPSDIQSMRLAISQVNTEQGLEGQSFVFIECDNAENADYDSLSQEEASAEVGVWLADAVGVPAILGCDASAATQAAFLAVEPFGTLMISPASTSPALTDIDGLSPTDSDPGLMWRTIPPDSLQGEVIASFMQGDDPKIGELGVTRVAVIYESGSYGEGLQEIFYQGFSGDNRTIDLFPFAEASERDKAVAQVGASDVEEVLFIASGRDDIVSFLFSAGQMESFTRKKDPIGIFLTDAAYYEDIFDEVQPDQVILDNIRGTRPSFIAGQQYKTFVASYAAIYGAEDPGPYGAYSYDAAWLLAYGAAWSLYQDDLISGIGMARGLRKVSAGAPVNIQPSSWNTVKANFQEGSSIDVTGASGSLDYDPATGETTAPVEVWGVERDGQGGYEFTVVTTVTPD